MPRIRIHSTFVRQVCAILSKDFKTEWRTWEVFMTTSVFAVLVVVVFHFAIGANPALIRQVAAGVLWVALIFATVLGLQRAAQAEKDEECLQGMLATVCDNSVIFIAKTLANMVYLIIISCCTLPLFSLWLHINLMAHLGMLCFVLVLGIVGLSIIGTLFSLLMLNFRGQEVMLPLLFLPISVPVTIAAVYATEKLMAGKGWADIADYLTIMGVFDTVFLVVALLVFDYVVEE